jgi:hypothetical protein
MSTPSSPIGVDHPHNSKSEEDRCSLILHETIRLLGVYRDTSPDLKRLDFLLTHHFQDDATGQEFRSQCCFGRSGKVVSLQVFNELCILPNTQWCVRLAQDNTSEVITASIVSPVETKNYTSNFATTAASNIIIVLKDILLDHPHSCTILSSIPRAGGIPLTWSNAILGPVSHSNPLSLPSGLDCCTS